MRPDLFAGSALRDDSHRILARLANGGSVPAPARQWRGGNALQRSRLAAVVALFAAIAAAWAWLQDQGATAPPAPRAPSAIAPAEPPLAPTGFPPQHAATIVSEAPAAAAPLPLAPSQPPLRTEARNVRPRAAKPVPHGPAGAPIVDNDEDVALLTAMLKHGKQQKPSAIPPKE